MEGNRHLWGYYFYLLVIPRQKKRGPNFTELLRALIAADVHSHLVMPVVGNFKSWHLHMVLKTSFDNSYLSISPRFKAIGTYGLNIFKLTVIPKQKNKNSPEDLLRQKYCGYEWQLTFIHLYFSTYLGLILCVSKHWDIYCKHICTV